MKNIIKFLGIIALVAAIGFALAACGDDNGDGDEDNFTDFKYSDSQIIVSNGNMAITGYKGVGGNVTIPSRINGKSVTVINTDAFRGVTSITSITIPDSVVTIKAQSFLDCTNLVTVNLGNKVSRIERIAFSGCNRILNITIPNSVSFLGTGIFDKCTSLISITFLGQIPSNGLDSFPYSLPGDLQQKYINGGIGTYTRENGTSNVWSKQ